MKSIVSGIELIEHACYPSPQETAADVFAAIRGICLGAEDADGEHCLGDFPKHVQLHHSAYPNESWYTILSRLCEGKSAWEAITRIANIVKEWKGRNPVFPTCRRSSATPGDDPHWQEWPKLWPGGFYHAPAWGKTVDADTFELMGKVLSGPEPYLPGVSSLREVLAFLAGIRAIRRPQHGTVAGIGSFDRFIRRYFGNRDSRGAEWGWLDELAERPFREACLLIAELLARWLEEAETFYYAAWVCPVCHDAPVGFRKCSDEKSIVATCGKCDGVWLRPDAISGESSLRLSANHVIKGLEGVNCSVGISAGARWATLEEIGEAGLDHFVKGIRHYGKNQMDVEWKK